jgi:hypothetical protein
MSLPFLYQALCPVLQLVRLSCRTDTDLAIEVVVLARGDYRRGARGRNLVETRDSRERTAGPA